MLQTARLSVYSLLAPAHVLPVLYSRHVFLQRCLLLHLCCAVPCRAGAMCQAAASHVNMHAQDIASQEGASQRIGTDSGASCAAATKPFSNRVT